MFQNVVGTDESGQVPSGRKILDTMKEDGPIPGTSKSSSTNGNSNAPTVSEIEERLAALRGVPVETVRKPRLVSYSTCTTQIANVCKF